MVISKNFESLMQSMQPGYYWAMIFGEWEIVQYAGDGKFYRIGIEKVWEFEDFSVVDDRILRR